MQDTPLVKEYENTIRLNLCELEINLKQTLKTVAKTLDQIVIHHEGKDVALIVPIESLALVK